MAYIFRGLFIPLASRQEAGWHTGRHRAREGTECNMKGPDCWGLCPAWFPTAGKPQRKSHKDLHKL